MPYAASERGGGRGRDGIERIKPAVEHGERSNLADATFAVVPESEERPRGVMEVVPGLRVPRVERVRARTGPRREDGLFVELVFPQTSRLDVKDRAAAG
jgi:hypothetical protein